MCVKQEERAKRKKDKKTQMESKSFGLNDIWEKGSSRNNPKAFW